jgi:drug/metabolite transporter (DMT)-like permease
LTWDFSAVLRTLCGSFFCENRVIAEAVDVPVRIPVRPASPRNAYLLMLASAASFASMSACSHGLSGRCDWRIIAVARAGIAFALTTWLAKVGDVRVLFRWPATLWMRSIVGSFSMLFTFYALANLPVATAVTLFNTFPIWVTLLAWPVLKERPSAAFALALASGIAGVVLIENGKTMSAGEIVIAVDPIRGAIIAALFAAVCTAVVMLGLHRLRYVHSLAIVVHFSAVATVVCALFAAITPLLSPDWRLDWSVLYDPMTLLLLAAVGVFATLGQITMTRAFGVGRPQRLAVVGLTQVVFALGFDFAIWRFRPDALTFAGLILILAPAAWLVGRRRS